MISARQISVWTIRVVIAKESGKPILRARVQGATRHEVWDVLEIEFFNGDQGLERARELLQAAYPGKKFHFVAK